MTFYYDLSPLEQDICTRLWTTQSQSEIDQWIAASPKRLRTRIIAMQMLLIAEVLDQEELDLTMANSVIDMVK